MALTLAFPLLLVSHVQAGRQLPAAQSLSFPAMVDASELPATGRLQPTPLLLPMPPMQGTLDWH